jgi:hypothetical protein
MVNLRRGGILVNHARAHNRRKRGAGGENITLDEAMPVGP